MYRLQSESKSEFVIHFARAKGDKTHNQNARMKAQQERNFEALKPKPVSLHQYKRIIYVFSISRLIFSRLYCLYLLRNNAYSDITMTTSSEKEVLAKSISVEHDESPRMRKKSPTSRKRNVTKYGSTKDTEIPLEEMPRNLKNAEGSNTNSFYYVAMNRSNRDNDVTLEEDSYDNPINYDKDKSLPHPGNRKLVPDLSWGTSFPVSKLADETRERSKIEMTSFSQYGAPIAETDRNDVLYEVRKTIPGGFPFIKLAESNRTDDVTDSAKPVNSENLVNRAEKSAVTSRHAWPSRKNLLKFHVFTSTKRHAPPMLPKCILDAIEIADKVEGESHGSLLLLSHDLKPPHLAFGDYDKGCVDVATRGIFQLSSPARFDLCT